MRNTIVTGSTRGLGLVITKTLLASGHRVVGLGRQETDATRALSSQFGDQFAFFPFDLRNTGGIKGLYIEQLKYFGPLTGLVNNAAVAYDDILTNLNERALVDSYHVNVFSALMLTKYVVRDLLLHRSAGSIVFIGSVSSRTGYKGLSMYASTKGALEGFIKSAAREWGSKGIRFNCVTPGFMETDMSAALTQEQRDRIYKRTCLQKATSPESVARLVEFLLSDGADSITGEAIGVDSGTI